MPASPSTPSSLSLPGVFPPPLSGEGELFEAPPAEKRLQPSYALCRLQPLTAQPAAVLPHVALQTLPKELEEKLSGAFTAGPAPLLIHCRVRCQVTKSSVICEGSQSSW